MSDERFDDDGELCYRHLVWFGELEIGGLFVVEGADDPIFDKPALVRAGGGRDHPFLTAKERDIDTGLDYFGPRHFAATQGRFTPIPCSCHTQINGTGS